MKNETWTARRISKNVIYVVGPAGKKPNEKCSWNIKAWRKQGGPYIRPGRSVEIPPIQIIQVEIGGEGG